MTTIASTQTTITGRSPTETYKGLTGNRSQAAQNPEKILALLLGPPGSGKSRLVQDCPTGYYMNFERVSPSHPNPQSPCWPTIGADGRYALVTWKDAVREFDGLRALSKTSDVRPTTVFIDSVPAMTEMITEHIMKHAAELRLHKDNNVLWRDMDGRAAWVAAYDMFIEQVVSLNNHGYGVYMLAHVSEKIVPIGVDQAKVIPDLTVNDGLWARLKWRLEMVASIRKSQRAEIINKAPVKRTAHTLTVSTDPLLMQVLKCKYPMPDVELPEMGSWGTFLSTYNQAARSN